MKLGDIHPSINSFLGPTGQKEPETPFMATFYCVLLRIIEGRQNPGSTLAKGGALFDPSGQKGGVTDERSLAVRVSVLEWRFVD